MDLNELTLETTTDSQEWFPNLYEGENLVQYFALALAGEAGEVANHVKKQIRDDGPTDLGDELAGVLVYLTLLASAAGVDLEEAYKVKQRVNRHRFGPHDFYCDAKLYEPNWQGSWTCDIKLGAFWKCPNHGVMEEDEIRKEVKW